jgi:WD40 repeat protein
LLNLGHQFGITGLIANANLLISSDSSGLILIWNVRTMAQINAIQPIDESGVTSLSIWNNCIIASYVNGMIRFFDPENGEKNILMI